MRYLKLFENFDFNMTHDDNDGFQRYFLYINNDKYELEFIPSKNNIFYRELKGHHNFETIKDAFKVGKHLGYITKKFIKEINPNALIIPHISSKEEEIGLKLNQRAKLGFRYLKDIEGYKLTYYKSALEPNMVYCYIQKNVFNVPFYEVQGISKNQCVEIKNPFI